MLSQIFLFFVFSKGWYETKNFRGSTWLMIRYTSEMIQFIIESITLQSAYNYYNSMNIDYSNDCTQLTSNNFTYWQLFFTHHFYSKCLPPPRPHTVFFHVQFFPILSPTLLRYNIQQASQNLCFNVYMLPSEVVSLDING